MPRGEEGKFQDKIISWLETRAFVTKFSANGLTKVGIPDILFCRNGKYFGLEVKKEQGIISDMQQYNINSIRKNGGLAWCIKPSNWEKFTELFERGDFNEITNLCKENEKEITKI
jgi:hypothetical protein